MIWLLLVLVLPLATIAKENYICENKPGKNKEVCVCDEEVCKFELVIEHLQTFTVYEPDAPEGTRGRVYYINKTTGELNKARDDRSESACNDFDKCIGHHTVDGSTYRSFIAINKRMPGPTLIVNEGSIVLVDVVNLLATEETSIHWHGVHQKNTPWMDGIGYISQCPIESGTTFRYIFNATPAGTFWYHSHSGPQRTDGLFGAFIVREKKIPQDISDIMDEDLPGNHTLSLLDWQREASLDLFVQIHSSLGYYHYESNSQVDKVPTRPPDTLYENTCSVDRAEVGPVPYWSGLINGKGKHKDLKFFQTRISSFNVASGKTYRFRLIGAQGTYAYRFSIDSHKLQLIATDGYFIEPVKVDYIIIHTGERYDFLLTADQTGKQMFIIRAETLEVNCNDPKQRFSNDAVAVLLYDGSSIDNPTIETEYVTGRKTCSSENKCNVANCPFENYPESSGYNCSNLHVHELELLVATPKEQLPKSEEVDNDSTMFFNFGFDSKESTSTINGRNFRLPTTSLQTQGSEKIGMEICDRETINNNEQCKKDCTCVHMVNITSQKTHRFVLSSLGGFAHPVHLHGHSFHVVKVGYGTRQRMKSPPLTEDLSCDMPCKRAPEWSNNEPPAITITDKTIRKDTIIVPAGGYVVIDFIADNPGYWFLHCHIESHQLEGMALVVNERNKEQNPAPDGMPTCGNFDWSVDAFREKLNNPGRGRGTRGGGGGGRGSGSSAASAHSRWQVVVFALIAIPAVLFRQ